MGEGFPLRIWSGLIDPKHRRGMGTAIWEFLWLIDKVTKEENGRGYVLGGKPVTCDRIASALGISRKTANRNLNTLRNAGYIEIVRCQGGHSIIVLKSKKRARPQTNPSSHVDNNVSSDANICSHHMANNVPSPRSHDMYKDSTEDITGQKEKPSSSVPEIKAGSRYFFTEINELSEARKTDLAMKAIAEMATQPLNRQFLITTDDGYMLKSSGSARTAHKIVMRQVFERENKC